VIFFVSMVLRMLFYNYSMISAVLTTDQCEFIVKSSVQNHGKILCNIFILMKMTKQGVSCGLCKRFCKVIRDCEWM